MASSPTSATARARRRQVVPSRRSPPALAVTTFHGSALQRHTPETRVVAKGIERLAVAGVLGALHPVIVNGPSLSTARGSPDPRRRPPADPLGAGLAALLRRR